MRDFRFVSDSLINSKKFKTLWEKNLDKHVKFNKDDLNIHFIGSRDMKYIAIPEEYLGNSSFSYENGYFYAIKCIFSSCKFNFSDSLTFPIIYLSRHYVELALKNSIINLLIITGSPFYLGNFFSTCKHYYKKYVTKYPQFRIKLSNFHNLEFLKLALKDILDSCDIDIMPQTFWNSISIINKISKRGDESRYPIDRNGNYNYNVDYVNTQKFDILYGKINLLHVFNNVKYAYNYFNSLEYLLINNMYKYNRRCSSYILLHDPYIKGVLYNLINHVSKGKIKSNSIKYLKGYLKSYAKNLNLKLYHDDNKAFSKDDSYNKFIESFCISNGSKNVIGIYYNKLLLFTILKRDNNWILKVE